MTILALMNDSIFSQPGYAVFAEAELSKDFFRVLPESWRSPLDSTRRFLEIDGHSRHSDRPDQRMIDHRIHTHRRDLRIVEKRKVVPDAAARDAFLQ